LFFSQKSDKCDAGAFYSVQLECTTGQCSLFNGELVE